MTSDRNYILILCSINIIFSIYYAIEAIRLDKIFKLEDKHIFRFGRRIGIITLIYFPQYFFITSLLFFELNNLHLMMVFLIFLMESLLFVLVFKEVYDLLFINEAQAREELDKNRKRYLGKVGKQERRIYF